MNHSYFYFPKRFIRLCKSDQVFSIWEYDHKLTCSHFIENHNKIENFYENLIPKIWAFQGHNILKYKRQKSVELFDIRITSTKFSITHINAVWDWGTKGSPKFHIVAVRLKWVFFWSRNLLHRNLMRWNWIQFFLPFLQYELNGFLFGWGEYALVA